MNGSRLSWCLPVCVFACKRFFLFLLYNVSFTWSIVKGQLIYSLCVYLSMCVCLKVSENQHLLQGRHQVSFTNALSAQSSTHPCDQVTHRNRYSVYNLRNSQVLSFDAFVSVCVGLCGLHFEYLLHYLNVWKTIWEELKSYVLVLCAKC